MEEIVKSIWTALAAIQDPELRFSIVDLGLVRTVAVTLEGEAAIIMTLTSLACPVGEQLRLQVEAAANSVPGVVSTQATITFDTRWSLQLATPAIQEHFALLGIPLTN